MVDNINLVVCFCRLFVLLDQFLEGGNEKPKRFSQKKKKGVAVKKKKKGDVFKGTDSKDDKDIFFYDNGDCPDIAAFENLLEELRRRLASGTVHGIAVTCPPRNTQEEKDIIKVQLTNSDGQVITVIINTPNVYVLGYLVHKTLTSHNLDEPATVHYFKDTPLETLFKAFPRPQYTYNPLGFKGNYDSLGDRARHELGHDALNVAISNLVWGCSQRSALLVIIQMLSEAVRFKHFQCRIRESMSQNLNFLPDPLAISLVNIWSDLSEQIQLSGEPGVFRRPILVRSVLNKVVPIRSVVDVMREAELALMLLYGSNVPRPITTPGDDKETSDELLLDCITMCLNVFSWLVS